MLNPPQLSMLKGVELISKHIATKKNQNQIILIQLIQFNQCI